MCSSLFVTSTPLSGTPSHGYHTHLLSHSFRTTSGHFGPLRTTHFQTNFSFGIAGPASRAGRQVHSLPKYFSFGSAGPASGSAASIQQTKTTHSLPTNFSFGSAGPCRPTARARPRRLHAGPLPRPSHSTELVWGGQKALTHSVIGVVLFVN